MLLFFDFEVFKYDNLVVILDPIKQEEFVFINDRDGFIKFYESHKNYVWCGFNSRHYDQYIVKSILCDFNPYEVSKHIIIDKLPGYTFSSLFSKIKLNNYDVMTNFHGLKTLEGFMSNDIRETTVPFDIDRKLTDTELEEIIKYCKHDVEQTIEVFLQRKNEFDSQLSLIKTFELPLSYIGKTQAQLAAIILNAKPTKFNDEWDIRLPQTLKLEKYKFVADWFLNEDNHDYKSKLKCEIAGVPHIIAWGGLHGAISKYQYTCKDDELLVMADVDQLYPTLMIIYNLLSRAVKEYKKFEMILSESLRLKKLKMKKEREPYKRICNITYGAEGDKFNSMYDPLHRNLVCVYGQVLILDLIEKLDKFELIQTNTDGILIKIKKKDLNLLKNIVHEWEQRTHLKMSFDFYKTVIQKDVNNYLIIDFDGGIKSKGAYVKKLNPLDNDLAIVNKAIVDYMTKGIEVEETINNCNELIMFQKIVKLSNKYLYAWHNGKKLNDKTFRVFASKNKNDSYIGKQKIEGATIEKFANTPTHCFINNNDIKGEKVPSNLDKNFYIELSEERLRQFGVIL